MHSRCNFIVPNCLGFSSCSVSADVASETDVHGWIVSPLPHEADLLHHAYRRASSSDRISHRRRLSHGQRQSALEQNIIDRLEADAEEHPFEDDAGDEEPERKKLKRELRAEALARLEDAARTQRDFEKVIAWWDKLDANRERRERYHELSRSGDDVPFDYGASANELFFPDTLNDVLEKQIRKGDFIDAIFYCPYDIHELVTEEYLSEILLELKEDHKELLFLWAVRLFSSTRIAAIRQQSDRNIRKVRNTMMKKIRKELLSALTDKAEKQQPMTLMEKAFLSDNGKAVDTEAQK